MKKRSWIAMLVVAMSVAFAFADAKEIVVLHVNDTHGAILATADGVGGFSQMSTFINQVRSKHKNVLMLHAGDLNTGSALSNMFQGEADIKCFNQMGLDAAVFGNHEFDGTLAKLKKQMKLSKFAWISANIEEGETFLGKPYIVKEYDGVKVAVIGLTTLRTLTIASPEHTLMFTDEIEAAKDTIAELKEKVKPNIIIIAGHLGDVEETKNQNTSIKLAQNISGVDLIVDGHAHTYFEKPRTVNGIPIVSANEYGKYVGQAIFTVEEGKVTKFDWKPVAINTKDFAPDKKIEKILKPYVNKANKALKSVVMKTTAEFEFGNRLTRYQEMPLGDFVADAMMAYAKDAGIKVDGAFTNGGGIRANLPKGNVTRENILTVLPFENYVFLVTLRGEDVAKLFDFIGTVKQGAGAFAQVSKEIRYTITYDKKGNGKISNLTIGGKPLDKSKTYTFATNDYMAKGGDGYTVLTKSIDTFNTSILISTAVIDYASKLGNAVTPESDGRITVVGGTLP